MSSPSPLPSNMAMTTVRGRYGKQDGDQFVPIQGMQIRFSPAYPFVTNTTATPTALVIATAPKTLQTDVDGYLCDPEDGFTVAGVGVNRNAQLVSSDDPDITPHDWPYLVTFHGPGATNFRPFRTPLQSETIVDIAALTPQRIAPGTAPTQAEIAAANAAAAAAAAQAAVASIRRGQAGGVAGLDADGDVIDADGVKVLPGGSGGGGTPDLTVITGMSNIGKQIVATLISGSPASAAGIRGILGAGTGNSNLAIGTASGTAADAAITNTAIGLRALDTAVLHKAGDEIKTGVLTLTSPPVIPAAIAGDNPVTKNQLDQIILSNTGGVTAATLGLGNVNNTSDLNKPISTAQAAVNSSVATTLSAHTTTLAALQASSITTAQELIWNGNPDTTNATSYGTYDVTRSIHNFRGAQNPVDAGYTLAINDRWFQPEVLPVDPDPTPPTTITLSVTDKTTTGFRVNWTAIPGSTGYRVSRNAGGGGTEQPWPTTPAGTATDGPDIRFRDIIFLVAGATYVVTVQALPSNISASVTVPLTAATPPTEPLPPPATIGDNKYGFMVFLGSGTAGVDQDIAGIKAAGGTWARLGMYNAGSFTSTGVFVPTVATWDHFKYACQTAKAAGLKVIWDAADTLRIPSTLTDAQWIVWQKSMWKYMAQTLGPWVDAWQIFNEHDVRHIRDFSPVTTLTTAYLNFFRDALQGARNSIREHHTGPVGTTVFGYPMDEARITRWFQFHDVVSPQMDYIGLHAYPEFNGTVLTDFVNRVYARYTKPVAVLEFGVCDASGYGVPPLYLRVGDGIVIENNALLAVKSKLLCATLFSLRNRVQGGTGEGGFGILDNNWTKKAYWQTVVNSIARWN